MSTRLPLVAALTVAVLAAPAVARATTPERIADAASTLKDLLNIPEADKGIPQDLLKKAACIVVVPSLKKGAIGIGAEFGRGFASCRKAGGWTAPAAVKVEGGSFGFQIGGSDTEVVMLVMNEKGMSKLLSSKFTLGGDASIAAGPVGRTATAQTDASMNAEILSYSRSKGVFAGVSLSGATLREDDSANEDLYGKPMTNKVILAGSVRPPAAAAALMSALGKV
jgi:lipid-binding SYLF domain-containing protein